MQGERVLGVAHSFIILLIFKMKPEYTQTVYPPRFSHALRLYLSQHILLWLGK